MVFTPDEALKRAVKFFEGKGNDKLPVNQMGLYNDPQSDRMFVNVFLGSHIQSKKQFKFNREAMFDWMPKFEQKPIVLFKYGEHYEHPLIAGATKEQNLQFQQTKAIGKVLLPFDKPDNQGTWRGIGEIVIGKVKAFLKSLNTDQVPIFSSPQVAYTDQDYDIKKADPMHLALTDDPAFPPEISMITGVCEGDQKACTAKLATATAGKLEAGNAMHVCFADAIKEVITSAAANTNSSLKITNFSNNLNMPDNDKDNAGTQQTQTNEENKQSPAEVTQQIIDTKAKDALNRMIDDIKNRTANPNETPDPKATMDKATGTTATVEQKEDPRLSAALKELEDLKLDKRKTEISKIIPLQMVTDLKSGGINEKLLNEYVDYWINTKLAPKDISSFYEKQMAQMEVINTVNGKKVGKASNQDSNITNDDIANKMVKFDAPDVDNATSNEQEKEKIANASARFDYLDFTGMLVSNVSKKKGEGSARSMID